MPAAPPNGDERARLASYTENARPALAGYWNRRGWPADPVYFMEIMHDTGSSS